ncbi:MAG: peptide deformylase [Candidatus Yanofskybacteria bacterium]|nr:peptide deformylase [Candidatus Yanofskybacteria bacterium]
MQLTHVPHPVLAKQCTPLTAEDLKAGAYTQLIAEMKKDMVAHNGIGLAANQVGKDLALFVIDEKLAEEHDVPSVFANPEITEYGKESEDIEEGCLSIPGTWLIIPRSKKVMFKGLDEQGNRVKFRARGMLARVLQHETDHLNGLTIKDRAAKKSRSR